ncbi:MAG: hypothetical protein FWD71_20120 [Oscillospiraceae bacterium]|nr:hypothetical protein [Oscillospiraceae bacterium]
MKSTKRKMFIKTMFVLISVTIIVIALSQIKVYSLSESDVQNQVAASSKESVGGNVFIWFLCAIAFLKVSQKIESLLGSLGINVGHSGGSMLGEIMIAARGLSFLKNFGRGKSGATSSSGGGNTANPASASGGFAGAVGRRNPSVPPNGSANVNTGNTTPGSSITPPNANPIPVSNNGNVPIADLPNPQNVSLNTGNPVGVPIAGDIPAANITGNIADVNAESGSGSISVNDNNVSTNSINADSGIGIISSVGMSNIPPNTIEANIKTDNTQELCGDNVETDMVIPNSLSNGVLEIGINNPSNIIESNIKTDDMQDFETSNVQTEIIGSDTYFNSSIPTSGTVNVPTDTEISNTKINNIFVSGANNVSANIPVSNTEALSSIPIFEAGNIPANTEKIVETVDGGIANTERIISSENLTADTFPSYMGYANTPDVPKFTNVEIGDGMITGTETSSAYPDGKQFSMYNAGQYMSPVGNYTTVESADGTKWHKQYTYGEPEIVPYKSADGSIQNHLEIVQTMPEPPKRRDSAKNGK